MTRLAIVSVSVVLCVMTLGARPRIPGQGASTGTAAPQPPPRDTSAFSPSGGVGTIVGRVTSAATGTGVRGAVVTAYPVGGGDRVPMSARVGEEGRYRIEGVPAGSAPRTTATYSVLTEPDGAYAFTSLPATTVSLSVYRDGYFAASPHGTGHRLQSRQQVLTVSEGQTTMAPDLLVVRGGAIAGRVVDVHGDPVVRAQVVPMRRANDGMLRMSGAMDMTDDRGHYRLHGLPAGRYTVHVSPTRLRGAPTGVIQGDATDVLPAFAPGSTDVGAAEFVEVSYAGDAGLDVRLPRGRPAMVAGQVFGDGPEPLADVSISLRPLDTGVDIALGWARTSGPGQFVLTGIPPGRYQLVAQESLPSRAPVAPARMGRAGRTEITVDGDDLTGVAVRIGPGATVRGRVEIEGGSAEPLAGRPLMVQSLQSPTATFGSSASVEVAPDLTFTIGGVQGRQLLSVAGLPTDWWVKSITIGGRDVSSGYDYPRSGTLDECVIVLSARPTGITGRVESASPLPIGALVAAMPDRDDSRMAIAGMRAVIQPIDADGRFALRGVSPGAYVVAALTADILNALNDATPEDYGEFLRSVGTPVDVVEGHVESVSLRLVEQGPR